MRCFERRRGTSGGYAVVITLGALLLSACDSTSWSPTRSPTAPVAPAPPPATAPAGVGAMGGTVTINGEARPAVWVEAQRTDGPWTEYGTTMPSGTWEWVKMPAGSYIVSIRTPPGLTCDITKKTATVKPDQRTVVDFACVGEFRSSIAGFALNEFGPIAARVTLTGPVNAQTVAGGDGFFSFEGLPAGEYVVGPCNPVTVSVRQGTTALAQVDCS